MTLTRTGGVTHRHLSAVALAKAKPNQFAFCKAIIEENFDLIRSNESRVMVERIKQYILRLRFAYPRSIFDMSPADPSMIDEYEVKYRTTEDAFRADWQRVGESLGVAMKAYESGKSVV